MLDYDGFEIYWDGHAEIRVHDDNFTVLVDPFKQVSQGGEADLVLITHDDTGHFDPEELEKVCGGKTCVVVPESMEDEDIPCQDVEYISEGEVIDVFGIEIEAVPMYNGTHERGEGVGYRFVMRGTSFYVAGDTGLIEEAYELEGLVDVAFLPVDGKFTMDVEEAVKMAVRVKPEIAVPYHYGEPFFDPKETDLRAFQVELEDRNIRCEVLEEDYS